jgi:hypothetical protein
MNVVAKIVKKPEGNVLGTEVRYAAYVLEKDGSVHFSCAGHAPLGEDAEAKAACEQKLREKYLDVNILSEETFESIVNGGCFE